MSHAGGPYFRHHADQILASDNPEILPYDQNAFYKLGTYSNRDAEESLAHWEEQRDDNVELLRGLEPGQLLRTAHHTEVGEFTLGHLLNEWALHDLGNIRQLAVLVRDQLYYPGIGPFQAHYSLHP